MKGGGRRARDEGRSARTGFFLASLLPLLLSSLLSGCGLRLFSAGQASQGAHAVVLTRPDCPTFVARTLDHGFTVATSRHETYAPRPGDVFDGPVREGRSVFRLYPTGDQETREGGLNVPLDVLALDLDLAAARVRLDTACGPTP